MKVYEAIARAVADEGVSTVFALMGEANMDMLACLHGLHVSLRHCCQEGAVVAEAEGFARAGGQPAFCSVTTGSGLGNSLVSVTEAVRARAPIVLFTGQQSRDERVSYQR